MGKGATLPPPWSKPGTSLEKGGVNKAPGFLPDRVRDRLRGNDTGKERGNGRDSILNQERSL